MASIICFMKRVKEWIAAAHISDQQKENAPLKKQLEAEDVLQDGVQADDSASQTGVHNPGSVCSRGSRVSRSTVESRVSVTRVRQEAEHAALLERAAALKRRQQLEQEEAELQRLELEETALKKQREIWRGIEIARIKAKKEELEMETALAESSAKLKVLNEYERSEDGASSHGRRSRNRGSLRHDVTRVSPPQPDVTTPQAPPQMLQTPPMALQDISSHSNVSRDGDILKVMQKQNVITELLVKQQKQSQLPTKDIPVFRGDALQYKSFIRAFEHSIEQKTDNDQDKLAYIDKALQWPQIKSEDGKALNAYAMFLVGCRNTMEDIESLEEMDNPTNLRTVVSKLPYKMKERWRAEAYNIKERRDRRAKFTDLVSYIERQAKIATDPLRRHPRQPSYLHWKERQGKTPAKKEKTRELRDERLH
ncbi:hypothetical protein AAFF_G00355740 [Aldrovandia affinis]|uniref:Uncharacterized protein n=1 Tax=Aldrovandia affinis TaxID=143900 RepID=A0AAD7R7J0_9TELE|nr:hypothetical protein AAFF_G00355740 [Aldrovandia affinis]